MTWTRDMGVTLCGVLFITVAAVKPRSPALNVWKALIGLCQQTCFCCLPFVSCVITQYECVTFVMDWGMDSAETKGLNETDMQRG